jgi:hypothetical protein
MKIRMMDTRAKRAGHVLYYMKYLGLALIGIGIPVIITDPSSGAELPLMVGLFTLLIATERVEDERSVHIKTTSLYIAFIVSYAIKLVSTNLYDHQLISFQLTEINHFIILVLSCANVLYFGRMFLAKR